MKSFKEIRHHIREAYRGLSDNLREDPEGPDGAFPGMTTWEVLYGHETRMVLVKLTEAMQWLRDAEESVG